MGLVGKSWAECGIEVAEGGGGGATVGVVVVVVVGDG